MSTTDLQTTVREMWETRPARPRDDRQVAGVAAALARRYDVDPVLVRVGFVVAAFAGIGAALYIAGWVALPDSPEQPGAGRRSPRPILVVGLAIATVVAFFSLAGLDPSTLLAGLIVAGLLVVLHRNRAHLGQAGTPDQVEPATPGEPPAHQPPAWDPLGVAPYAWDLPEPPPPPTPARPRVTLITLAIALLVGGVTGAAVLLSGAGPGIVFGVVLAVLGGGLVVGAFLHTGRGLIPIALVTGLVAWAVAAAPFDDWNGQLNDVHVVPASAAQVQPRYEAGVGSFELDLRRIDLTVPVGTAPTPLHTAVRAEAGNLQVFVPPDADVTVRSTAEFGRVAFETLEDGGPESRLDVIDDPGRDGVRSGRPIVLDLSTELGNVEVHRG